MIIPKNINIQYTERGVVLERRAATLEEEQLGLRQQIAKLVEQVCGSRNDTRRDDHIEKKNIIIDFLAPHPPQEQNKQNKIK